MKIYWIIACCAITILVGSIIVSQQKDLFEAPSADKVAVAETYPSDSVASMPEPEVEKIQDPEPPKKAEIMPVISSNTMLGKRYINMTPPESEVKNNRASPYMVAPSKSIQNTELPRSKPIAQVDTSQQSTQVDMPQQNTHVEIFQHNTQVDTPQHNTQVDTPQHNTYMEQKPVNSPTYSSVKNETQQFVETPIYQPVKNDDSKPSSPQVCRSEPVRQRSYPCSERPCRPAVVLPSFQEEVICSNPCAVQCNSCDTCCAPTCSKCEYWRSPLRLTISHTEGRWLGNDEGYTSFGLFSAICGDGYCRPVAFVDIREHVFNNGRNAANIGGGLRYARCDSVYGINAYYDYRKASWGHVYRQFGLGFERLNPCLDIRLNLYFPVGDHTGHSSRKVFDNYIGDFKASCQEHRRSVGGGDLEFGRFVLCKGPCKCYDLYAAVGTYYYDYTRHHEHAFGGQVRLLSHVGRFLTFEVKAGYDPVFHGQVTGKATVSIPLDCLCNLFNNCGSCDSCSDRCCVFYSPVVRQEIITLEHKKCCWHWNWDSSKCHCR